MGESLVYFLVLGAIGAVAGQVLSAVLQTAVLGFGAGREGLIAGGLTSGVSTLVGVVLTPVLLVIGIFISAAITHVSLMIVGGANRSFEATFSVLA